VRLYLAGFGPGILIMTLYSGYIITAALLKPGIVPAREHKFNWKEKMAAGKELLPVLLLMLAVMGVLYLGVATATEAAAAGVIGGLLVAAVSRSLTWENFKASLMGTTTLSCMICFFLAGGLPSSPPPWRIPGSRGPLPSESWICSFTFTYS
jgi:TRAP-type mannitol/chloroaromatic compound transport system permease large subunit